MPLCKALRKVAAIDLNGQGGSGEPPLPRLPRLRLQLCRFDVHENVGDARVALLNRALHPVCNLVAFVYGNVSVHADV